MQKLLSGIHNTAKQNNIITSMYLLKTLKNMTVLNPKRTIAIIKQIVIVDNCAMENATDYIVSALYETFTN